LRYRARRGLRGGDRIGVHLDAALARLLRERQQAEQGRFSRPARSEDEHPLARIEGERDVAQGDPIAEALAHVLETDQGHVHSNGRTARFASSTPTLIAVTRPAGSGARAPPFHARSNAVPWSTELRTNGRPRVTLAAPPMPPLFAGINPWSWYIATTIPRSRRFLCLAKNVSAGEGPSTPMPRARAAPVLGSITRVSSSPESPPSPAAGLLPRTATT